MNVAPLRWLGGQRDTDLPPQKGTPIGANDLLIAAHAIAARATLVTANVRKLSRVPKLPVENWLL